MAEILQVKSAKANLILFDSDFNINIASYAAGSLMSDPGPLSPGRKGQGRSTAAQQKKHQTPRVLSSQADHVRATDAESSYHDDNVNNSYRRNQTSNMSHLIMVTVSVSRTTGNGPPI